MKKIIKNLFSFKPSVGDKVITHVGFGSRVEGVVDSVYPDYCWITDGRGHRSTASFSYCHFEFI